MVKASATSGKGEDDAKANTNDSGKGSVSGGEKMKKSLATVVAAKGKDSSRKRRVRLLHVSRPLIGGLLKVPENIGELDMATVDKYTAVLKSYPGENRGGRGRGRGEGRGRKGMWNNEGAEKGRGGVGFGAAALVELAWMIGVAENTVCNARVRNRSASSTPRQPGASPLSPSY